MATSFFLLLLLYHLLILTSSSSNDVACLHDFQSSVSDPDNRLTWNFSHISICNFTGVECWNTPESRVLSLVLPSFSLSGPIPSALRLCSSLTVLDLSSNSLSGPIPSNLCSWLPYLVSLDLSSNSFSGPIPANLSSCEFLNTLSLAFNSFSGSIPASLSLPRLKKLNLTSNCLSGPIPSAIALFGPSSFDHNPSLCGPPLSSSCSSKSTRTKLIIIFVAGIAGASVSLIFTYLVAQFFFPPNHVEVPSR